MPWLRLTSFKQKLHHQTLQNLFETQKTCEFPHFAPQHYKRK